MRDGALGRQAVPTARGSAPTAAVKPTLVMLERTQPSASGAKVGGDGGNTFQRSLGVPELGDGGATTVPPQPLSCRGVARNVVSEKPNTRRTARLTTLITAKGMFSR